MTDGLITRLNAALKGHYRSGVAISDNRKE